MGSNRHIKSYRISRKFAIVSFYVFSDYHKAKEQYKRTINEIKELAAKENIQVLAGFEVDFF